MKNEKVNFTEREIQIATIAFILGKEAVRASSTKCLSWESQKVIYMMMKELERFGDPKVIEQIGNRAKQAIFQILH